ncbi:substrate-binding domain-containing protein [Streptomyces sp. H27-C3]|uniref:substrate-binding domain-containing protein n=1 Tax=Streptomyces sp. H27-C3 TaxID=3046305 RepID=UPI0024B9B863|nr:substrate-binding domain-containing protein [Streptomyces sp. H27-C3]MDJ0465563.1 substrate-binding domain-containing protein [Streptomyces sp. H27-C3]
MGRHSLPDEDARDDARSRSPVRRRTVAIATVLVLGVAGGAAVAVEGGFLSFAGSCADSAVHLEVVASPDVAPAVREVAALARDKQVTSDGQCLDVDVVARDAYKVADTLSAGKAEPDYQVWIPDSDLWVQRAQSSGDGVRLTPVGNIASSPVALATVPSAAKSLGWPEKTYTWAQLSEAATEKGTLRLGAADPARSATGLLGLTSIAGSTYSEGPDADTKVAAAAKLLSQRISDSDQQVSQTLAQDESGTEKGNPRRNQAVLLSEQAAFAHNTEDGTQGLELFYPTDGTTQLDYPYALVDEGRLSTDESRAALRFMTLLGERESRNILAGRGFRTPDKPASPAVVRAAGGRAPQPYASAPGKAPSQKDIQQTLGMWTITVQSARLTTVVDASGSMATLVPGRGDQTRMDVTKASLIQALAQFTPDDEVGLWDFATNLDGPLDYRRKVATTRLGDPAPGGRTHRDKLSAAFSALSPVPDGATGLYDTTLAAYKDAQADYASGRFNAVVILTDGSNQDTDGISRSGLITELRQLVDPERPVPLIAIAVGPDADSEEVEQIASVTGGGGYQVTDPADIHAVILKAIMEAGQGA